MSKLLAAALLLAVVSAIWRRILRAKNRTTHVEVVFRRKHHMSEQVGTGTTPFGTNLAVFVRPLQIDNTPTPGATVTAAQWTITDASLVTLTTNSDFTASVAPLKVGTCGIAVTTVITDKDGISNTFTQTGTIIVTAAAGDARTASVVIVFD